MNKYKTVCVNSSGKEILDWQIEAKNASDAEAKAYLNCMSIAGESELVKLNIQRI